MTTKQIVFRKSLLAKIHMHRAYKHMQSLDSWQDFLSSYFNVTSSAKLSIKELKTCLDLLNGEQCGSFKPDVKGRKMVENIAQITVKQKNYIMKLLSQLGKDKRWFLVLCFKTLKLAVFNIEHLSKEHASIMILALERILKLR